MPAFSGRLDWNTGLIWRIGVVPGAANLKDSGDKDVMHVCPALVDTGATRTCIAKSVVNALGLESIGRVSMNTAGGTTDVNVYDVHVALFVDGAQNPDGSYKVQAEVFGNMRVLEFTADGEGKYQSLVGRDILRNGVLNLSMDGHYAFAF